MAFVRRLVADVAFYSVLDAMQRAVSVLLVPVYTRVLSQREFGNYDLIFATCALVGMLVDLQQSLGFIRFYPEHIAAGTGRRFVGTHLVLRLALGIGISAAFIVLGETQFLEFGFFPSFELWRSSWLVAAAAIPAVLVAELLLLQTRLLGDRRLFALGALGNVGLSTTLCIVLVAWCEWGVFGAVVGQSVGNVMAACVLAWGLRRHFEFAWDRSVVRRLFAHVLPIVPGYWVATFSAHIGRFFVFGELGAAQAAVLAVCLKVANLIGLFSMSFRMAWQPLAMRDLGQERSEDQFAQAMRVFLVGGLISLCAFAGLSGAVVAVLAPASYAEASKYLTLFAFAAIIGEIEMSLQLGNQVAGKTYWMSVSAIIGIVLNIAVMAWLTPVLGIGGVVAGAIASSISRVFVSYVSSQINHPIRYDGGAFARFVIGCAAVMTVMAYSERFPVAVLVTLLGGIGGGLSWLSLRTNEKRLVLGFATRLWQP